MQKKRFPYKENNRSANILATLFLAMLLLTATSLLFVVPARAGTSNNSDEAAAATIDLFSKMSARDWVAMSHYIPAEGFSELSPGSATLHRLNAGAFEKLFASGVAIDLRAIDVQAQSLGDTAIATGTRLGAITPAGAVATIGRNAFTMVWMKTGNQWQLQHIHLSVVQP